MKALQLPSRPPESALFTGTTTGCFVTFSHSAVSSRITLPTSAGSMATQPWSTRWTSALPARASRRRRRCMVRRIAYLPATRP